MSAVVSWKMAAVVTISAPLWYYITISTSLERLWKWKHWHFWTVEPWDTAWQSVLYPEKYTPISKQELSCCIGNCKLPMTSTNHLLCLTLEMSGTLEKWNIESTEKFTFFRPFFPKFVQDNRGRNSFYSLWRRRLKQNLRPEARPFLEFPVRVTIIHRYTRRERAAKQSVNLVLGYAKKKVIIK